MRALILLLSAAVVTLAALILLADPAPARSGPVFQVGRLIQDAIKGEWATYQDEAGNRLTFKVEHVVPPGPDRPPRIRVRTELADPQGQVYPETSVVWDHYPTRHGIFPLTAPNDPDGLDRVWVWRRIQRLPTEIQGKPVEAWRVELIDPALPAEGGADHVVAWLDEDVPVFGLIRFTRRDRTWELVDRSPR